MNSITGYQFLKDNMHMDQDFTPLSVFSRMNPNSELEFPFFIHPFSRNSNPLRGFSSSGFQILSDFQTDQIRIRLSLRRKTRFSVLYHDHGRLRYPVVIAGHSMIICSRAQHCDVVASL